MRHVVWDWNGTLFDDFPIVVDAFNASLAGLGVGPVDSEGFRDVYARPVNLVYERVLGRNVSAEEMESINDTFFRAYREGLPDARLAADAVSALEMVRSSGGTQSVLSLFWHEELNELADRLGIAAYMTRVQGNRGPAGEAKADLLAEHVASLLGEIGGLELAGVVAIGDSLDDADAAWEAGVGAVLYNGGSHHRSELAASGFPVADSLVAAVREAFTV